MSDAKAVCAKHEQAYAVKDGCPYCEVVEDHDADAFSVKLVYDGNSVRPWDGLIAWCPQPAPDGPVFFGVDFARAGQASDVDGGDDD